MANVQLSWLTDPVLTEVSSAVVETPRLSASIGDTLDERTAYYEIFLRNGPDLLSGTALSVGFYTGLDLSHNVRTDAEPGAYESIYGWANISESGRPMGVFTVFGFDNSDVSYISKFKDGSMSAEELALFHHNWLQGSSPLNAIKLSVAKTYTSSGYTTSDNLETSGASGVATDNSRPGVLKVLIGVRFPSTVSPSVLRFRHNVCYEEAL